MFEYAACVVRVVDGDTLIVDIDLGFHVWRRAERLRLLGIDAPERDSAAGQRAVRQLRAVLPVGAAVVVRTRRQDKYGRWLSVVLRDGADVLSLL